MINKLLIAAITILSLLSHQSNAQPGTVYSDVSILLKADTLTKSVLISNIGEDKSGNQSPFIGAVSWSDSSRKYQCRSLLSFNYGLLPTMIKPDQIVRAELVLYPLELQTTKEKSANSPNTLIVRRVLQPWEDSLANWSNQPQADTRSNAAKLLPPKKKEVAVKFNVTALVKDMFQYGNYGFQISNTDSFYTAYSQWFASARYDDESIRPALLLTVAVPYSLRNDPGIPPLPMTASDRAELIQTYFRPEPVTTTPPVPKEPIKE